jgi:hypothetical protein
MTVRHRWLTSCWLASCWLLLSVPSTAQESQVSCLDPGAHKAPRGMKPPPTHPDFQKGLEAVEAKCWPDAANFMCRAEENWPEDGELDFARFYDRWFPHYLPRYYLGLAFCHLGCYERALVQFESSILNETQNLEKARKETDRLRDLRNALEILVEQGTLQVDGADCGDPKRASSAPGPGCAPGPGRCPVDLGDSSP